MSDTTIVQIVIASIIAALGANDYRKRELATLQLERLCPAAVAQLQAARQHEDMEIALRAGRILERYAKVRPATGPMPWLDMLPKDWPDRAGTISRYLDRVGRSGYHTGWPEYREATCLLVRDLMLEQGWSRERVIRLLARMHASEREWHKSNPWSFYPAIP